MRFETPMLIKLEENRAHAPPLTRQEANRHTIARSCLRRAQRKLTIFSGVVVYWQNMAKLEGHMKGYAEEIFKTEVS